MDTQQILNTLPANVVERLEWYKVESETENKVYKEHIRRAGAGYVTGLFDAGLITDWERKELFLYFITITG